LRFGGKGEREKGGRATSQISPLKSAWCALWALHPDFSHIASGWHCSDVGGEWRSAVLNGAWCCRLSRVWRPIQSTSCDRRRTKPPRPPPDGEFIYLLTGRGRRPLYSSSGAFPEAAAIGRIDYSVVDRAAIPGLSARYRFSRSRVAPFRPANAYTQCLPSFFNPNRSGRRPL